MLFRKLGYILLVSISIIFLSCNRNTDENNTASDLKNDFLIYRSVLDSVHIILPNTNSEISTPLIENLIIATGNYNFSGQSYSFNDEGLYRILDFSSINYQRIVFEKDIFLFLSSLSWIVSHGSSDNYLTNDELSIKAKNNKLYLTCGHISRWALSLLEDINIPAREVMTLTLREWNKRSNGHNMIEVYFDGKWTVFDLDNNCYFTKQNKLLSAQDLLNIIEDGSYSIESLANDSKIQNPWITKKKPNYDNTFYAEYILTSEESLRAWYAEVIQVLLIKENESFYFSAKDDSIYNARIKSYSKNIRELEETIFNSMFYENTTNKAIY